MPDLAPPRFLTLDQVAEELATSVAQIRALVRRGDLRAIQIGGRRQWRVERTMLEAYIERAYTETAEWLEANASSVTELPADEGRGIGDESSESSDTR